MELDRVRRNWEQFGRQSPLKAILNDPGHGAWKLDEFFQTGEVDVAGQLADLGALGIEIEHGRALDFGCGVGRLTQALAGVFAECDGVDVAESMVKLARKLNRRGAACRYHVNTDPDLRLFPDGTFDLVLSIIVLQHVPPDISRGYVREFMRVLRPGGVALFQIPAGRRSLPPLPDSAFRAEIAAPGLRRRLPGGRTAEVRAVVTNTGSAPWRRGMAVRLGNRWRRDGGVVLADDGRSELPHDLAPGEQTEWTLTVNVPGRPGDYELELDLVQEGVTWFAERGSPPLRLPVTVRLSAAGLWRAAKRLPGRSLAAGLRRRLTGPPAVMDMHCVSRAEVTAAVEAGGGTVVDVSEMDVCGDAFESFRYIAVR